MISKKYLASVYLIPVLASATEIPLMGETKAESHQICGQKIDVEVLKLDEHSTLIGLKNNKTQNLDLFVSSDQLPHKPGYSRFTPVKFDSISKNYIATDLKDLDIVWGSVVDDKQRTTYSISLGPETYDCGLLQKWPNERANELYGEQS